MRNLNIVSKKHSQSVIIINIISIRSSALKTVKLLKLDVEDIVVPQIRSHELKTLTFGVKKMKRTCDLPGKNPEKNYLWNKMMKLVYP